MSNFCPFNITTVSPASVPLITMLCRTAGIRETVNQMVSWNDTNSRISPGLLIETLIICILCERRPLWKVHKFWNKQDMDMLFPGVDIFLKNPVYLGPIYLQSKRRINALGYVFILALLVASYLEYRVRKSLQEQNKYLVWPRGHKNYRPSLQTIFEVLDLIKVLIVDGERRYFPRDIDRQALEMVKWAGFDPADIYLKHLPMSIVS